MGIFKKIMLKTYQIFLQLLLLPIYAVLSLFCGIGCIYQSFMEFSKDFVDSITDPDYLPPLGPAKFYALKKYRQKAWEAEEEYDSPAARQYWEMCAAYFDTGAMLKAAEHHNDDDDDEADQKRAIEWYAVAASFGNAEGEYKYTDLTGVSLSEKEKIWIRRNFIGNRKQLLSVKTDCSQI